MVPTVYPSNPLCKQSCESFRVAADITSNTLLRRGRGLDIPKTNNRKWPCFRMYDSACKKDWEKVCEFIDSQLKPMLLGSPLGRASWPGRGRSEERVILRVIWARK